MTTKTPQQEFLIWAAGDLHPLEERAERAHQEVLGWINALVPRSVRERPFARNGYHTNHPHFKGEAGIVRTNDLKSHPLVRTRAADMISENPSYKLYATANDDTYSPREFLKALLAHEYGHIIGAHALYKPILKNTGNNTISPESDEAFAFWFGDMITDTKTPRKTMETYTNTSSGHLMDPQKLIAQYDLLTKLTDSHGRDATFNIHNLEEIFFPKE